MGSKRSRSLSASWTTWTLRAPGVNSSAGVYAE